MTDTLTDLASEIITGAGSALTDEDRIKLDSIINTNEIETNFDKNMKAFMKNCQETIKSKAGLHVGDYSSNPLAISLNYYYRAYTIDKPRNHFQYFQNIFNANRIALLSTLEDDRWLSEKNIFIQYQGHDKQYRDKTKNWRIRISDIYRIALELRSKAEETYDDEFPDLCENNVDLIRPDILLLHLFRMFYFVIDTRDKRILGNIVTELENRLGISEHTVPEEKRAERPEQPSLTTGIERIKETMTPDGLAKGVSRMYTAGVQLLQTFGIEVPSDIKPPDSETMKEKMTQFTANQNIRDTAKGFIESFRGKKDFKDMANSVTDYVSNPETMGKIQSAVTDIVGDVPKLVETLSSKINLAPLAEMAAAAGLLPKVDVDPSFDPSAPLPEDLTI